MNNHPVSKARSRTLVALSLMATFSLGVQAATITWSGPAALAGNTDVNLTGNLLGAYAAGSAVAVGPVGGVTFAPWTAATTGDGFVTSTVTVGTTNFGNGAAGISPFSDLSTGYRTLISGGLYLDTAVPQTLTLNKLIIGTHYLVQFWVNDSRGSCCTTRSEVLDGQISLAFNVTQVAGGVGQQVTGDFIADATNQVINISPSDSAQINALQLRVLPAPGPITWAAPVTISGDFDVNTDGTLVGAYALGSTNAAAATVNGVTFTGWRTANSPDGRATVSFVAASTVFGDGAAANPPFAFLSPDYQTLLSNGLYRDTNASQTLTLNNLTPSSSYRVQVWASDSRGFCCTERLEVLDGTAVLNFNNTHASGGVGQYALGTFTANASQQTISISPSDSAQINALQLRLLSGATIPTLHVYGNGNGTATLYWDASFNGFTLSESTDLVNWGPTAGSPVPEGQNLKVIVTVNSPKKYYRLVQ